VPFHKIDHFSISKLLFNGNKKYFWSARIVNTNSRGTPPKRHGVKELNTNKAGINALLIISGERSNRRLAQNQKPKKTKKTIYALFSSAFWCLFWEIFLNMDYFFPVTDWIV
jgi:hypothetical protein